MSGTIGENRVRVEFNPSGEGVVYDFKRHTAELINLLEKMKGANGEQNRLIALAQTSYEEAAMWAVKAATSQ